MLQVFLTNVYEVVFAILARTFVVPLDQNAAVLSYGFSFDRTGALLQFPFPSNRAQRIALVHCVELISITSNNVLLYESVGDLPITRYAFESLVPS